MLARSLSIHTRYIMMMMMMIHCVITADFSEIFLHLAGKNKNAKTEPARKNVISACQNQFQTSGGVYNNNVILSFIRKFFHALRTIYSTCAERIREIRGDKRISRFQV